jgi:hypothetical protein
VYLPLDHTAKFNKYYEMANELANKGKWKTYVVIHVSWSVKLYVSKCSS